MLLVKRVSEMRTCAVIPARGGSKGIPRKNIVDLGGEPLIAWTLNAAKFSEIDRIIVSTDDTEVSKVASRFNVEVISQPSPMKDGTVNAVNVILHVIDFLKSLGEELPDAFLMLLPTSPFRTPEMIDNALEIFENGAESVIGVSSISLRMPSLRWVKGGFLIPVEDTPLNVQRQDSDPVFHVNGAMFIASPETLEKYKSFHIPGAQPFYMSLISSIDINEVEDLAVARLLVQLMTRKVNANGPQNSISLQ
jgi:CMP-N-acetylneuraminic acid synthetase